MTWKLRIVFALTLMISCLILGGRTAPAAGAIGAAFQPAPGDAGGRAIADPRADPEGTLRDALAIARVTPPVAGPLEATGSFESAAPEYLSSGVQVEQFFAQYSFVVPATPDQNWMMGFTFWDDGRGNYYDLSILSDAGSTYWGLGVTADYGYRVEQTDTVTNAAILDSTPGAVNTLSLIFYDQVAIVAGNNAQILAQVDLGVSGIGDVRAKVGWVAEKGTPEPPVTISISDFSVWELPSDGVLPVGGGDQPGPTPGPAVVQTPGAFVSGRDQAASPTPSPATALPTLTPTPGESESALLARVFQKERNNALAGETLWEASPFGLGQKGEGDFDVVYARSVATEDCYVVATFVNSDDMSTVSDYGIGIRDNNDNREFRFVVDTDGQWSISVGNAAPFAKGMTTVDATPGASITLEVIAKGPTGMFAVNGQVVTQVDLSANLNTGRIWIATGMNSYTRIDGRRVVSSRFAVYQPGP